MFSSNQNIQAIALLHRYLTKVFSKKIALFNIHNEFNIINQIFDIIYNYLQSISYKCTINILHKTFLKNYKLQSWRILLQKIAKCVKIQSALFTSVAV